MSETSQKEIPALPRTVRGTRPDFFETPGVDEAMSMILVLAQEFTVLRERMDSAERAMAKRGIDLAADIEALEIDDELLKTREIARQDFYGRLFFIQKQRRAELEQKHSAASYLETLDKVASGEI